MRNETFFYVFSHRLLRLGTYFFRNYNPYTLTTQQPTSLEVFSDRFNKRLFLNEVPKTRQAFMVRWGNIIAIR